jgi:hypothetical protein
MCTAQKDSVLSYLLQEDRPRHPPRILKTEVISNPFTDIEPRNPQDNVKIPEEIKTKVKRTKYGVKQLNY